VNLLLLSHFTHHILPQMQYRNSSAYFRVREKENYFTIFVLPDFADEKNTK